MVRGTVLTFRTLQAFRDNTLVFEDEYESSPHQTKIETNPLQNHSATVNMVSHLGGDDVIPYVSVSVSLDKSTSGSVDPSLSVCSSRSADPGLVRVYSPLAFFDMVVPTSFHYFYVFALLSETDVVRT